MMSGAYKKTITIKKGSDLIRTNITKLIEEYGIDVSEIKREGYKGRLPNPFERLIEGDRITVKAKNQETLENFILKNRKQEGR